MYLRRIFYYDKWSNAKWNSAQVAYDMLLPTLCSPRIYVFQQKTDVWNKKLSYRRGNAQRAMLGPFGPWAIHLPLSFHFSTFYSVF